MGSYLLVSDYGELLPVGEQLMAEEHSVQMNIMAPRAKHVGLGIVPEADLQRLANEDILRGTIVINMSRSFAPFADKAYQEGWRTVGRHSYLMPDNTLDNFKLASSLGLPIMDVAVMGEDANIEQMPVLLEPNTLGEPPVYMQDRMSLELWSGWANGNGHRFLATPHKEGFDLNVLAWVSGNKLLTSELLYVVRAGDGVMIWSPSERDKIGELMETLPPQINEYYGPIMLSVRLQTHPRKIHVRRTTTSLPSWAWGSVLAHLDMEMGQLFDSLFDGKVDKVYRDGFSCLLPASSKQSDTLTPKEQDAAGESFAGCPIDNLVGFGWDSHRIEEGYPVAGGVVPVPVMLKGHGEDSRSAYHGARDAWEALVFPMKRPPLETLHDFNGTISQLKKRWKVGVPA